MGNIDKLKYNGVEYDLGKEVDDTLTQEGAPADAEAVGDALDGKVDKVTGKELSTNDYTTAEKTKLAGIADEANKTLIDTTLSITGQAADAKATGDAIETKVDMTDGLFNLDTTQGSGTTDGDLYTAINKNGWGSVVSNQLMDLKALLTDALEIIKRIPNTIAIPSTGMDLNTIAGTCCYYASGNAFAANCTNCPTNLAFRLWMIPVSQPFFVTLGAEWQYYVQIIVDMNGNVYIRNANTGAVGSSMQYGSWSKILGQKIPSISVTNISGGTLTSAVIYNGSDSVCQGLIRVNTTNDTSAGSNLYTATVKIDGVNADGLGVGYNGQRVMVGTLVNGTLTVRNASALTYGHGDVTLPIVLSKRII